MSEARKRNLAQSQSKIFENSPAERIKRRDNPQSQSKIFTPLQYRHKPFTFARAQYEKTSICLGKDNNSPSPSPPTNRSNLSPAGKKSNQIHSTKYLIGNEKSTFYKKSVNQTLGVPDQFEPKYNAESAFERKQKEFNGGFSPSKQKDEENFPDRENLTARERKLQDRVSVFDSHKCTNTGKNPVKQVCKENIRPELYNPKNRKGENFSSEVFGDRTVHEYKKPADVKENEDDRKKNHMFSDLFGRTSSPNREKVKDRLIPMQSYYNANSRQNLEYDPRGQICKHLASQIDIGDSPLRVARNRPKTPQEWNDGVRKGSEQRSVCVEQTGPAQLYELEVNSVPSHFTAAMLKELCGGLHVVSLTLDIDNFTGSCRGTGLLKIRTNNKSDLSQLTQTLKSKSIQLKEKQENLGRKSNYSEVSNTTWFHPYDYKKSSTPLGARESKMKNLESSFFSSQVKWSSKPVESFNNELSAQIQWLNTKNATKSQY